jgi:replicative DNA helicase
MTLDLADKDSEKRLIMSLVSFPEFLVSVEDHLFTGEEKDVFNALKKCYAKYGEITREGLSVVLGKEPPVYIDIPSNKKPQPIIEYLEKFAKRRTLNRLKLVVEQCIEEDIYDYVAIKSVIDASITNGYKSLLDEGVLEFSAELAQKVKGNYNFISTGLPFLDYMFGGEWPRRGLTVVLGEGGSGKTALVVNSIVNMAMNGTPSLFLSLEMVKSRLVQRMVSLLSGIDGLKIKSGSLNERELSQVNNVLEKLQGLPIFIVDNPRIPIEDIVNVVREHKYKYDIKVFFVDYLQIIGGMGSSDLNMSELYGYYSSELRNIAVELDISAVLLAQQNRTHTGLHSILGSGRVGHVADVVFELNPTNQKSQVRPIELSVHKNRDGPLGSLTVAYQSHCFRFTEQTDYAGV